ncbi:MAG: hypothetical protein L3J39_13495 [Verrucomicrobiales bacterium]|nr:hypothetical protein [Verrucomicrobiales bacterium]
MRFEDFEMGKLRFQFAVSFVKLDDDSKNRKAVFVDTDPDFFVDGKACRIELSFDGEKIRIEEMNSRNYRGKTFILLLRIFGLGRSNRLALG